MNELKFLEVMSKIDDALIREADENQKIKEPKSSIYGYGYVFGSVAAATLITVGSVVFYSSQKPDDLLVDHSEIQQNNFSEIVSYSDNQAVTMTDTILSGNTVSSVTDIAQSYESTYEVVTTVVESDDTNLSDVITQIKSSDESTIPGSQSIVVDTKMPVVSDNGNEQKGGISIESRYYLPFMATIDPDSDAYGDDEVHHIDVRTVDGFYRQLNFEDYEANGISTMIKFTDYGDYIGKIVEVNDSDYHGNSVESQEPILVDADVYYYAPSGKNKAFIIVEKGEQCSIFFDNSINAGKGFQEGLAFFDVQSADDIECIEYKIDVPSDNGQMITIVCNIINDKAIIEAFYNLICELQPEDYSALPEHTGTPQWLIDAWEIYDNNPDSPDREDYHITIKLKDGVIIQDVHYQPYIGNGYVTAMQELTPEQNSKMKSLFQ